MKYIIAVMLAAFVALPVQNAQAAPTGTYSGSDMVAYITSKSVEIRYVGDDNADEGLYWKGSFPWKKGMTKVRSKGDLAAMEDEMFASTGKYKDFRLKGNDLLFDYTIMGRTEKVTMHKE